MAALHEGVAGRSHVHTLRLEELTRDYHGPVSSRLTFLGLRDGGGAHQALLRELRAYDSSRWGASELDASTHVNPGRAVGLESRDVLAALKADVPRSERLANLSSRLGY